MMRRKSSGLIRSRFGVDGKLMIGPPRPSRPPDRNATRSCRSVMMSIARTPLSIASALFCYFGFLVLISYSIACCFFFSVATQLACYKLNVFNLISLTVLCVNKKTDEKKKK
jgi:hypothetical protein